MQPPTVAERVRLIHVSHRCITYAARGYPPSDVPQDLEAYTQAQAVADAVAVLDHGTDAAERDLSMG